MRSWGRIPSEYYKKLKINFKKIGFFHKITQNKTYFIVSIMIRFVKFIQMIFNKKFEFGTVRYEIYENTLSLTIKGRVALVNHFLLIQKII